MKLTNRVPCLVALVIAGFGLQAVASSARAQEKTSYGDIYRNVLGSIGFGTDRDPIDYTPRPPIAVPPSNDLPPPVDQQRRASGFPNDPDRLARRKALVDPRQPVPPSEANNTRSYLIEPPADYFDAAAVTATGAQADHGGPATPKRTRRHKAKATAAAE